ncbi:Protein kinase C delta [Operophtera brumata]|uniref:Protein kinase C delta n=1 Tax=Operophtera brumata TaxID=104452 RepID=A0A0L7KZY2_OPEBR|nr:Protein kinase C delta [Operophtera brumata]
MPLYSEHISSMYYSGSPSYTSPSYGYKSSYTPLGTSYSASYLSPGGSYSKHSSLSSYTPHRAPISSRWIPRSYSPMLTPISERGTASPIRINSPRRIPLSKRSYGTPSYIQRPININTESIDVSRDRYRHKPAEPSASTSLPPQRDDPVKDNKNSPFMPRVDGKPETGIDSSPGIQQNTIKRGRTVVRLHTIKRKEKDSPRKPVESSQMQSSKVNKQDATKTLFDDVVPGELKDSLSWREKLSEDLVYVDKKEKKSLGTKLVEKFILKDVSEKDSKIYKCDQKSSEGRSEIVPDTLLPNSIVPSTSKSPDRRCSMEMLAEQACLLDSLIRGENLSTATLDLSKVGIADESKNKFDSSDSIKRRKTDDKGNPLKTTKSDHSLHDSLNKSINRNKDSKILTNTRSLKKSQSGGSICRLDSITEFPKEPVHTDLPAIQENRPSPKEQKIEQKPKLRTKITASVEISPPTSPLKFRIENVTVEEKHHTPKKEISFSYDVDETPIQDITLQGPKTTLRKTIERNSIKKKSKNIIITEPISPEPDDGNFWAKIGKRETVNLKNRKQNIEALKEETIRSFLWFPEDDESGVPADSASNKSVLIEKSNDLLNQLASSNLPAESEPNNILQKVNEVNVGVIKDGQLKTVSSKLAKSKSSDNMQKLSSNTNNSSLKEMALKHDENVNNSNKSSLKTIFHQDAKIKEDLTPLSEQKNETEQTTNPNLSYLSTPTSETTKNFEISKSDLSERDKTVSSSSVTKSSCSDETQNDDVKLKSKENGAKEASKSKFDLNVSAEILNLVKIAPLNDTPTLQIRSKSESRHLEKDAKPISKISETIESIKANLDLNLSPETSSEGEKTPVIKELALNTQPKIKVRSLEKDPKPMLEKIERNETAKATVDLYLSPETPTQNEIQPATKLRSKSERKSIESDAKPISEKIESATNVDDVILSIKVPAENKTKPVVKSPTIQSQATCEIKTVDKDSISKSERIETIASSKSNVDLNLSTEPTAEIKIKPGIAETTLQTSVNSEGKGIDKDLKPISGKIETIESDKANVDGNSSAEFSAKSNKKQVNTVLTLQTQAMSKVKEERTEPLVKNKQVEPVQDVKSNVSQLKVPKSKKKNISTETTEANCKKKVNKADIKVPDKNIDLKAEEISSAPKDKICETCKKSLGSDSTKTSKLNATGVNDPSTAKLSQDKIVKVNAMADKPKNNVQEAKSVLDSSVLTSSDSNSKTERCASTSQIPVVIETKNIPNETIASDTEPVQTSVASEEHTGEEYKAEIDAEGHGDNKLKQLSIKEVAKLSPKTHIKEEKPAKPLIATPRPLMKRAPQVIHSESSDSSSEEDSSEGEDTEASEESGEFFECENNPDGRTSTGSNDSGFDSSAPTSPASFLQIKKGKFIIRAHYKL